MAEVRQLGAHHPLLKEIRRAASKGVLTESGCLVAESLHLIREAQRSGRRIHDVIASASAVEAAMRVADSVTVIPAAAFAKLATTEHSQGVLALVEAPVWRAADLLRPAPALTVILDGVQDPGNAGAIIRAAEAFGATGVASLPGTVSFFNPKTIRASAGSLFRTPFVPGVTLADCASTKLYAAVAHGGTTIDQVDWCESCALVIGSEAHGVSPEVLSAATPVRIPTSNVESLNAAVAAGIILYEARRQRGALQ